MSLTLMEHVYTNKTSVRKLAEYLDIIATCKCAKFKGIV